MAAIADLLAALGDTASGTDAGGAGDADGGDAGESVAGAGAGCVDAVTDGSAAALAGIAADGAPAAACLALAPFNASSPCSSTVTRANSRSRSPFSVSIAEDSRRDSVWLSLATD